MTLRDRWLSFRHGWLWWHVTRHWQPEEIARRLAYWVPRKVALFVYIRVLVASNRFDPDMNEYKAVHDAWEQGEGR